jgi:hypothetical protein
MHKRLTPECQDLCRAFLQAKGSFDGHREISSTDDLRTRWTALPDEIREGLFNNWYARDAFSSSDNQMFTSCRCCIGKLRPDIKTLHDSSTALLTVIMIVFKVNAFRPWSLSYTLPFWILLDCHHYFTLITIVYRTWQSAIPDMQPACHKHDYPDFRLFHHGVISSNIPLIIWILTMKQVHAGCSTALPQRTELCGNSCSILGQGIDLLIWGSGEHKKAPNNEPQ